MATHCFIPILGKRIRVTTLDSCGFVPAGGTADATLATDGFVTVTISAEVEEGTEIVTKKASGALCVNEKQANSFKRLGLEIEFCGVNPALLSMVSNAEKYISGPDTIGFTMREGLITKRFALELWTGLSAQACVPGQESASGYLLIPHLVGGTLGDIAVDGENAVTFSVTGAYTKGPNTWGVGPYNVISAGTGTNEVQTVTITGTPTGGTFTLTFMGQTTSAIAYNAVNSAVQTALRALSTIGSTGCSVAGGPGPGTPYTVTFTGPLAGVNVAQMSATGNFTGGTTPTVTVTTTTAGTPGPGKLPTSLDPFDHLLMMDTGIAPPPSACDPVAMV